jgi:hypothetical protein
MQTQAAATEIILINGSPFLHEILKKAINKKDDLNVIAEADRIGAFPQVVKQVSASWAFLLLSPEEELPDVVKEVMVNNPSMGLLVMATDGSRVRVRWMEQHDQDIEVEDLNGIFSVLQNKGLTIEKLKH